MPTYCCVPLCKNAGGHVFPKDPARREKWLLNIGRDNWCPTKSSVVCSSHFNPEDYIASNFRGGYAPIKKTLRQNAVPSRFAWKKHSKERDEEQNHCREKPQLCLKQENGRAVYRAPAPMDYHVPVKPEILSLDFGENDDCDDEDSNIPIKIEHVRTGDLSIQGPTSDADSSFSELEDSSRATSSSNATQKKKMKPLKEHDRDYYKKFLQKTPEETSVDVFEMRKKEHKWLQKEHEEKMRILREERQINKLRLEILKLKKESLLNR